MSLIPTVYRSSDPGAPALSGQVGSLCSVLDSVLVDGYGTGMDAKAGAGWSREFTATSKRVFRNSPTLGTGCRLRVDDSSVVGGSNARYALVRAYGAMSDIDTGTDPSPTVAQLANGCIWPKSTQLNGTSRAWMAIANERFIYLFVDLDGGTVPFVGIPYAPMFAGDLASLKPGDSFQFMVSGSANLTTWSGSISNVYSPLYAGVAWRQAPSAAYASYMVRNYSQTPGSAVLVNCSFASVGESGPWGAIGAYPNPVNGGLIFEKGMVHEGAYLMRGFMPNLYVPIHQTPFTDGHVETDVPGTPAGTQLLAKSFSSRWALPSANIGQVLFDISNGW